MPQFLTLQRFNDIALANELALLLQQHNIPYALEDNRRLFNPSMSYNEISQDIYLKLDPADFTRANTIISEHYESLLNDVDKDYYLFTFTDDELMDIMARPDEWGYFDYQLAKRILATHGKPVSAEELALLKQNRQQVLAAPAKPDMFWVYAGYIIALAGGLGAFVIGAILAWLKKTLPDGSSVYAYSAKERYHGKRIVWLGLVCFAAWVVYYRLR